MCFFKANIRTSFLSNFDSPIVNRCCRFCMAKRDEIQEKEVSSGHYILRSKEDHDRQVSEVEQDPNMTKEYGVKGGCALSVHLEHFHVVDGFPPDILHDLLEGIVPFELSLGLYNLIKKGYFTLDTLNNAIKQFPYTFNDKTNQPQLIPKTFSSKKTIGGNGHENWTLMRLLPLMVGHHVPENDETWEMLMNVKDILELAFSSRFTEESFD